MRYPRERLRPPQEETETPGFAPNDLSDDRKPGDWQTRYADRTAQRGIRREALYLWALLLLVPAFLFVCWLGVPGKWCGLDAGRSTTLSLYLYSWLGGTLGGTLFATKWLYHSVAKNIWNQDRFWWRLLTPHIAGGLGFTAIVIIRSSVFQVFNATSVSMPTVAVSIGFLAGYLSDGVAAKLSDLAQTFFGATERHE